MQSLYSNELRTYIRTRDWPLRLRWEVVEFEDCLKIRLFRENINALSSDDKLKLAALLNDTLTNVRKRGVPIYTWVDKGDGRNGDT